MTSDQATDRASTIDLTFVSDARLRAVLAFYYEQAEQAFKAGAYLGTVVASGAVAEGLLTWLLQTNESRARRASTAVEGKIEYLETAAADRGSHGNRPFREEY